MRRLVVRRAEHHQRRPPPAVHRVLRHGVLRLGAAAEGQQQFVALALVEGLLLADADHRAGVRAVRAAAQRHLVGDRRAVHQPADGADVGPGQGRVVEDRGVLLAAGVQLVEQLVAAGAQGLGGAVEIQAVARLVLHLGHQDRLAAQGGGAGDPVGLRLHADDLGVGVLRDLADEGRAVGVRHPVPRLDALVRGHGGVEAASYVPHCRAVSLRPRSVVIVVTAAIRLAPDRPIVRFNGESADRRVSSLWITRGDGVCPVRAA